LIQRGRFPDEGRWALTGGFVEVGDTFDDQGEDLMTAAERELAEECGFAPGSVPLVQLHTFGKPDRDPRTRIVTVVYFSVLPLSQAGLVKAGDDAAQARWVPLDALGDLEIALDHREVIGLSLEKIRRVAERSPLFAPLLNDVFSLDALEKLHRQAWGEAFDLGRFQVLCGRLQEDGLLCAEADEHKYSFTRKSLAASDLL